MGGMSCRELARGQRGNVLYQHLNFANEKAERVETLGGVLWKTAHRHWMELTESRPGSQNPAPTH